MSNKPYYARKLKGKTWIQGPMITWLWDEPTLEEALICLNTAYEEGRRAKPSSGENK